jgi:hypothetical protein
VQYDARCRKKTKDGLTQQDHWEAAAKKGSRAAKEALEGPPFPRELDYLYGWLWELHGRSGASFGGLLPLSYTTIADWSRLTGQVIRPHEVAALIQLDAILCVGEMPEEGATK